MRILIVEDDLFTATNIKEGLAERGYLDSDVSRTYNHALERFKSYPPDLVLLDIHLSKQTPSGVELAHAFNAIKKVPIIFVTGETSQDTIKKAIEARPANYMLKPIELNALQGNIELALINFTRNHTPETTTEKGALKLSVETVLQRNNALFVKSKKRFEKMLLSDILWVQADNVYTCVNLVDGKKPVLSMPLMRFEEQVNASSLLKINRSQIINIDHIDFIESGRVFIGSKDFRITEKYREHFFEVFS